MKKLLNKKVITAVIGVIVAVLGALELSGVVSPVCAISGALDVAPAACVESAE